MGASYREAKSCQCQGGSISSQRELFTQVVCLHAYMHTQQVKTLINKMCGSTTLRSQSNKEVLMAILHDQNLRNEVEYVEAEAVTYIC